jgi:hypothetical protein
VKIISLMSRINSSNDVLFSVAGYTSRMVLNVGAEFLIEEAVVERFVCWEAPDVAAVLQYVKALYLLAHRQIPSGRFDYHACHLEKYRRSLNSALKIGFNERYSENM